MLGSTVESLVGGAEGERQFVDLELECVDEEGDEVEAPPLRYVFPRRGGRSWGGMVKSVGKRVADLMS